MDLGSVVQNIRIKTRNELGRRVLWATRRGDLGLKRDSDICIEGFPRSANTYGVLLVEKFARKPLKIAHHLHIPAQLLFAVKWDIPAVLLIRKPADAIASLVLREQGISVSTAIHWYLTFHSELIPVAEQLHIWTFEELVKTPATCLIRLNEHLGWWEVPEVISDAENQELFDHIDELDKEAKQGAGLEVVNSRPNESKKQAKEEIQKQMRLDPQIAAKMDKAEALYSHFIQVAS